MDRSPVIRSCDERRLRMVPLVLALGLVSGGVALSYAVLWGRELLNVLGSTTRASAVVLTAFMGGIAMGAWFAGRWSRRSTRPLLLFAAAEGLLAVIGFAFPGVLDTVVALLPSIASSSAFLIALLLVPAFLMGIALGEDAGSGSATESVEFRILSLQRTFAPGAPICGFRRYRDSASNGSPGGKASFL